MADQLSGIAIIICIAFGVLTFILLFLFGKRQITRFALKSRLGPHVPVGTGAPRQLILEIKRRLNAVKKIQYDPCVLKEENAQLFPDVNVCQNLSPPHLYRMKVVQDVKNLEIMIHKFHKHRRQASEDESTFYKRIQRDGVFSNLNLSTLENFLKIYELARYEPQEFLYEDYSHFNELFQCVKNSVFKSDDALPLTVGKKEMFTIGETSTLLMKKTVSFDISTNKRNNSSTSVETEV